MRHRGDWVVGALAALALAGCDAGPSTSVCVPGSTQECVGPGACRGGQACNAEGSGFAECVCGLDSGLSDASASDGGSGLDATVGMDGAIDAGGEASDASVDGAASDGATGDGATPDGAVTDGASSDAMSLGCSPVCTSSERCCGSTCVNRSVPPSSDGRSDSSFLHCNGCGLACDATRASSCSVPGGGVGTPRCLCGAFDQCLASEVCASVAGTWTCLDLSTDPENCGSVGHACADGETCSSGGCTCGAGGSACASGQACCAGSCLDVSSDPMHCGACDVVCGAFGPSCVAGACRCGTSPACAAPMLGVFPAASDLGESCCGGACVANTSTSCGCGVVCTGGDTCVVSGGGIIPGSGGVVEACCGIEVPLIGGACSGADAGFPSPADAGLPSP